MDLAEGQRFRRASGLVLVVSVLLVADAIVSGVSVSSSWMQVQLLQAVRDGYQITEAQADANDFREMMIGLVQVAIYIPLAILFLRYLWRANHNARELVGGDLQYTPGSCAWWFFVPFANLYKPFRAVKEIWNASDPWYDPQTGGGGSVLLNLWWGLWIIVGISCNISVGDSDVGQLIIGTWIMMVSNVLGVFLAVAALGVIRGIYRMQNIKVEMVFGSAVGGNQEVLSGDDTMQGQLASQSVV